VTATADHIRRANDDAGMLARGLKAALDLTNSVKAQQ